MSGGLADMGHLSVSFRAPSETVFRAISPRNRWKLRPQAAETAVIECPDGGLPRWPGTGDEIERIIRELRSHLGWRGLEPGFFVGRGPRLGRGFAIFGTRLRDPIGNSQITLNPARLLQELASDLDRMDAGCLPPGLLVAGTMSKISRGS